MGETTQNSKKESNQFPKLHWILLFFLIWVACGVTPIAIVAIGAHGFSLADSNAASVAGTIGDAFGLANSFFAAAALLFVIWSIRLQQQEIRENTESQDKQVSMMRETADLTAINHIYNHYSDSYGDTDQTGILSAIAAGHRRWAIRASFSSIDSVFEADRREQVERDMKRLAELMMEPMADADYLKQAATLVSSLLIDVRANDDFRKPLWPIYELLRSDPAKLTEDDCELSIELKSLAKDVVSAWGAHCAARSRSQDKVDGE